MIIFAIILGCVLGIILGINAPIISYTYSGYLAIAIIAALDSVFGAISSSVKGNFDFKVFVTGFFGNAILAMLLTLLGNKLNLDIYIAAIVVFASRMFTNFTIIRRHYLELWDSKNAKESQEKEKKIEE